MRSLLHPATAVAVIAVVISLTGTGYAVTQLPRDSVGPAQLQDGAVGRERLKAAAVTRGKIGRAHV